MRIREPWPSARTRQRRREFAAVFDGVPAGGLGDGLEIGGGDGFLASLVAAHCRSFVTTDSYRPRLAEGEEAGTLRRLVCDATVLPFADASFDFIFSSSLLEHVRDRPAAYREMHRCLRPGGVMVHIMPSRTWKALQMLFYYPHIVIAGIDLLLDRLLRPKPKTLPALGAPSKIQAYVDDRWSDKRSWSRSWKTIVEWIVPRPHGEFPGHAAEWRGFGVEAWEAEWKAAGFTIHRVMLLPLYSGYGFGFEWLRRLGERRGLSSHNAFVLTKPGETPPSLAWFEPQARLAGAAAQTNGGRPEGQPPPSVT
jgi:SAM-dependent methyltransferase